MQQTYSFAHFWIEDTGLVKEDSNLIYETDAVDNSYQIQSWNFFQSLQVYNQVVFLPSLWKIDIYHHWYTIIVSQRWQMQTLNESSAE